MNKPTTLPMPNHHYRDSHGALVIIESVAHNRVTFCRQGYQFPCVQPVERFLKEFTEVAQ